MQEVKDLVLYQVSTDRNYKVGDILEFGKINNGQGNRIENSKFYDSNNVSFANKGFKYLDSKNIFKNKKIIKEMSKALAENDFVLRELATEEVRKENFSYYPSRLKCMFLSNSKEVVLENFKTFYKKGVGTHYQAIAVKLNGKIFIASGVGLLRNGLSYLEYKEHAFKYWSQDQKFDDEIKEILFEGTAEVVEIYDEYDYDRKD